MAEISSETRMIVDELWEVGAIKVAPARFKLHEKWPDLPDAPVKLQLRTPENGGTLTPTLVRHIGTALRKCAFNRCINEFRCDAIAGVPNAGDPFATAMREHLPHFPQFLLEKQMLSNGERRITGVLRHCGAAPGSVVLLVDDLISQGGSKIEALKRLCERGYRVFDTVVFLDWQLGGREELEALGVTVHAVETVDAVLSYSCSRGYIEPQTLNASREFRKLVRAKQELEAIDG